MTTSFTLGGTVADYGEAERMSIKRALATEAGVDTGAVALTLTAGSVIVSAEIYVASQADVDSTATTLSTGMLRNAASLESALTTQFASDGVSTARLTVQAIVPPSDAAAPAGDPASNAPASGGVPQADQSSGFGHGLILAIVAPPVVLVLAMVGMMIRDKVKLGRSIQVVPIQVEPQGEQGEPEEPPVPTPRWE